jgi:hypothetical protein
MTVLVSIEPDEEADHASESKPDRNLFPRKVERHNFGIAQTASFGWNDRSMNEKSILMNQQTRGSE